jgi:hypothetical protein
MHIARTPITLPLNKALTSDNIMEINRLTKGGILNNPDYSRLPEFII